MSVHGIRVFTKWVVDTLTTGGLEVALGVKPSGVPAGTGWSVVYSIAGGVTEGSIADPNEDAVVDVQVTSVGVEPSQALWQADKVRTLLLAAVPDTLTDGRDVLFAEPAFAEPSLLRDDDVSPPVWYCPDRLTFRTAA